MIIIKHLKKGNFPLSIKLSSSSMNRIMFRALQDAEVLLHTNGAASSIDRVHTALHAYLIDLCKQNKISFPKNIAPVKLLRILWRNHPALKENGPEKKLFRYIFGNLVAIIKSVNDLRNNSSNVHPNELLQEPEALLIIEIVRSFIIFMDRKISNTRGSCSSVKNQGAYSDANRSPNPVQTDH